MDGGDSLASAPTGVLIPEIARGVAKCPDTDKLTQGEEVHHINQDKANNKTRNLVLVLARAQKRKPCAGQASGGTQALKEKV